MKATGVAVASVGLSLGIAATIVPALGGVVDGNAWLMCVICPLLIAWPTSAWQFWQQEELHAARSALAQTYAELQRAHDALAETARRDGLTGLLNRENLLGAAENARLLSEPAWLLILDLDHFKTINDRYGHAVGDDVLTEVALRLSSRIGPNDEVGRIGGEEFAVVLSAPCASGAAEAAERLRAAVAQAPILIEGGLLLSVTISVGGAAINPALQVRHAYTSADARLYEAKRAGRDRVVLAAVEEVATLSAASDRPQVFSGLADA